MAEFRGAKIERTEIIVSGDGSNVVAVVVLTGKERCTLTTRDGQPLHLKTESRSQMGLAFDRAQRAKDAEKQSEKKS